MRGFIIRITAGLIAMLLIAVTGEVAVRVYESVYPVYKLYDPAVGFRYKPGVSLDLYNEESKRNVPFSINHEGFRDLPRATYKDPLTRRVVVLGDSFVAAAQVNFEDSFHQRLQRQLTTNLSEDSELTVEVLNFGVSGYSTAQEYKVYHDYAAKYQPDVVVLCLFLGNDIGNNSPELSRKGRIFYNLNDSGTLNPAVQLAEDLYGTGLIGTYSSFYRFVKRKSDRLKRKYSYYSERRAVMHRYNVFQDSPSPEWQRAWQLTEALIVKLKADVESSGAKFLLMTIPDSIQVYPEDWRQAMQNHVAANDNKKNPDAPLQRVRNMANRHQLQHLDLHPKLQSQYEKSAQRLYFDRAHFNKAGHEFVGQLLAKEMPDW
ncbi:MAG: lysophospholipase L1-like esterase [Parasphingorhabdus sp.]|jgi:lysophospholipase L1-like esterase